MITSTKLDNKKLVLKNKNIITDELKKLGNLSKNEKIVLIIFAATAVAWVTRGLLWKDLAPFVGDHVIFLVAVATLLLPIMAVLSSVSEIDPILFMVPVAFATSYGFMMPVGTLPNAIAIGSGHVSIRQMVRYDFFLI